MIQQRRDFVQRAAVIAVVLFVASWVSVLWLGWAIELSQLDTTYKPEPEYRAHPWVVTAVAVVPTVVVAPSIATTLWWRPTSPTHWVALAAFGAAFWGVVLSAGWTLLDRNRRRGRGGRLGA